LLFRADTNTHKKTPHKKKNENHKSHLMACNGFCGFLFSFL
jgi:hypothetical protein